MAKVFNLLSNKTDSSNISLTNEYQTFRSNVPLKKVVVDEDTTKEWTLYDSGPRTERSPLICLPPVSGTADIFFKQMIELCGKGYRIISLEYPTYWTLREFIGGFTKLLDHLHLDKVHLFGASLGGFLAQKFAESTSQCPRVQSLFLCNSFSDTSIFNHTDSAVMFWMMPTAMLKKLIMGSKSMMTCSQDQSITDSVQFMAERLDTLNQSELASRLTLNCLNCYVEPQKLQKLGITIMDVFDHCALSQHVREEQYKLYPDAKRAHLKSGGNFPYLSRAEEVNMHLVIHLRQFCDTKSENINCSITSSSPHQVELGVAADSQLC